MIGAHHPYLAAERQAKLDVLGPRPPWWRPFSRRRWRQRHDAIMVMDVSTYAFMLRDIYNKDEMARYAMQPNPFFRMIKKDRYR